MSSSPVLALDLGGTRIRTAVVKADGSRLARTEADTPVAGGPEAIVTACCDGLELARRQVPSQIADALVGIGISSPGPVDPARGTVVEPPNLGPAFRDIPLAARASEAIGLPAFLDRDTNVAALGEHTFGAARGCDDFIYLTVSTGVGGAIVMGGRLLHGPDGLAGELGHVPVSMDGPLCGCGGIGHVEAYASGTALARDARRLLATGRSPFLAERSRTVPTSADSMSGRIGPEPTARDVAEGALAGDPACAELMDRARRALAMACVGYVNAYNPHKIVIGGSIAEHDGERLLGRIRDAIVAQAFAVVARHVEVVPAGLGGDVSLAGAHPLVMSRLDISAGKLPHPVSTSRPAEPVAATPRR